jgi:GTPase SAR1 family protein
LSTIPTLLVDPDQQRQRLSDLLDRMVALFEQSSVREAVGETALGRIRREREAVLQRIRAPFTLLVLGDFKRGKSTLVNSLVGAEIATVDVTPETVTVNVYTHGSPERAFAVLPDGTRAVVGPEELRHDNLVALMGRLPARPTHLLVEREAEWLQGLRLVDTPGLGDLDPELARLVQEWLPSADAVLFVITALSPLSDSERVFLKLSLAPAQLSKVCFAVNRIDALPETEDVDRVVGLVAGKLAALFPDSPVFPVSALHPEDARFQELKRHLHEVVLVDRDLVKLERAALGLLGALHRAQSQLSRLERALSSDEQRLGEQLDRVTRDDSALHAQVADKRAALVSAIEALGEESVGWMRSFVDRFGQQVATDLSRHPHEVLRKHFPFFLAERTREALSACLSMHQSEVDALLWQHSPKGADKVDALAVPSSLDGVQSVASPETEWTLADDIGMLGTAAEIVAPLVGPLIASVLVPLGLLQSHVGLVVQGLLNKTGGEQVKGRAFHEHVLQSLPSLQASLGTQVRKLYGELAQRMAKRFDELWSGELEAAREVLEQAQGVLDKGTQQTAEVRASLGRAGRDIEGLLAEAERLRADLERLR